MILLQHLSKYSSEIEPIAFYSPLAVESRSNVPSSSHQDIPKNPFHSIDLNNSSVPTTPGPYHEMLPDTLFEGDLPRNKSFESNILAASEELVIESLAMMREEARVEQNEPFQGEEIRATQLIFDKTPDLWRYPSSNSFDSESVDDSIQLKVEMRDVAVSRKGKEKVVKEVPRRRPTTRFDTRKFLADALKASSRSTAEIRSARTFKVSNFKMPESGVIEVSAEEMEKKQKKKKSGKTKSRDPKRVEKAKSTKEKEVNKQEIVDNLRKQYVLAGRVFDIGIINLPRTDSPHDMVEIQSWMHLFKRKSLILHEEEGTLRGYQSVIGKTCSVEFVALVWKLPTTRCAGFFNKVMKRLMIEHMYKRVIERKGIHGMRYGYFLTKVFKHFKIPLSVGKVGTAKQAFSENTLVGWTSVVQALERENAELRPRLLPCKKKHKG
ncbi:hypothetical protein EJD97_024514 [Solanum chilense]|uniref:Uncharacterized protein n=1 Tax=Solanum chilense TaxID=4083 RepID=A0A6N2C4V1_SOLCI|nr:hypothetical protein EJD97_024514 [Solanum chilense]